MTMPPSVRRIPRPLDGPAIEEMALAYVARFATSSAGLERYLRRKLRERGWEGDGDPPVAALVGRFAEAGYIDDAAFARMKAGSLLRRGYGNARVAQALSAAGIAGELREAAKGDAAAGRHAALACAKKRRLGPFGMNLPDKQLREKQTAAMLRAGHPLDSARILVNAQSIAEAEDWAAELDGDGE